MTLAYIDDSTLLIYVFWGAVLAFTIGLPFTTKVWQSLDAARQKIEARKSEAPSFARTFCMVAVLGYGLFHEQPWSKARLAYEQIRGGIGGKESTSDDSLDQAPDESRFNSVKNETIDSHNDSLKQEADKSRLDMVKKETIDSHDNSINQNAIDELNSLTRKSVRRPFEEFNGLDSELLSQPILSAAMAAGTAGRAPKPERLSQWREVLRKFPKTPSAREAREYIKEYTYTVHFYDNQRPDMSSLEKKLAEDGYGNASLNDGIEAGNTLDVFTMLAAGNTYTYNKNGENSDLFAPSRSDQTAHVLVVLSKKGLALDKRVIWAAVGAGEASAPASLTVLNDGSASPTQDSIAADALKIAAETAADLLPISDSWRNVYLDVGNFEAALREYPELSQPDGILKLIKNLKLRFSQGNEEPRQTETEALVFDQNEENVAWVRGYPGGDSVKQVYSIVKDQISIKDGAVVIPLTWSSIDNPANRGYNPDNRDAGIRLTRIDGQWNATFYARDEKDMESNMTFIESKE